MNVRRKIGSVIFICLCSFFFAQDDSPGDDKITVRPSSFSLRTDFSVPNPINSAWRKSMVGIAEGNLIFDRRFAGNLYAGIGYKASLFYVPRNFMFSYDLKTKMQQHCGFLSLGYDIYKSNIFFISPSINSGLSLTRFTHVQCKNGSPPQRPQYSAWFIEAQAAFTWMVDPSVGLSFHVSFVLVDHVWNPEFICLQDWIQLGDVNRNAITSYYNFGFGVYVGIGKGKTRAGK